MNPDQIQNVAMRSNNSLKQVYPVSAADQNSNSAETISYKTMYLSSKIDNFQIEIGPKIIRACSILQSVTKFTVDMDPIEVEMSQKQLEQFVELHNHFNEEDSNEKYEPCWVKNFFSNMSDEEFINLCWKADYLDSQRFLNNAAYYLFMKLQILKVEDFRKLLNIVNDYTEDEQKFLKTDPLKFFINVVTTGKIVENDNENHSMKNFIFRQQNFAFPESLMNFTFTTSKVPKDLFLKLYSTCKYFFADLKLLPCQSVSPRVSETNFLVISNENESIDLPHINDVCANFYVSNQIFLNSKISAEKCYCLFKKIIRHEIKIWTVCNKDIRLTVKEFKHLFSKANDVVFCLKVTNQNGDTVPVEELLSYMPQVYDFKYYPASAECYTSKTAQKIAALKRNVKLNHFTLHYPPPVIFNADSFAELIQNSFKQRGSSGICVLNFNMENKQIPMMTAISNYGFSRNDLFQLLQIPFKNDFYSMIIILPNERYGLSSILKDFDIDLLLKFISNNEFMEGKVCIPKFELHSSFDLFYKILHNLGITDAFNSRKADFSGIVNGKGICVSKVLHQAIIKVSETGTKAVAATTIHKNFMSRRIFDIKFELKADHPFLYLIVDQEKHIFFIGTFYN